MAGSCHCCSVPTLPGEALSFVSGPVPIPGSPSPCLLLILHDVVMASHGEQSAA